MHSISEIREDDLIRELTHDLTTTPDILVGVGDDCAVIRKTETEHTLLKTDTVVEGIHFTPVEDPERVGWKAAARVVSDFAAMGGTPQALLITIILPPDTDLEWVRLAYNGIKAVARKFNCSVVGGETSSTILGSPKVISVSGTGCVTPQNLILRNGARPYDLIYVTGFLGCTLRGKHLDFTPRVDEANWLAKFIKPTAMMDLSDGIAKDLPRLCKLSNCGFEIYKSKIPVSHNCSVENALRDGEDYELLFTISATMQQTLEENWERYFPDTALSHIGHITEPQQQQEQLQGGWDHFKQDQ